jgi:dihydropteroate synthase
MPASVAAALAAVARGAAIVRVHDVRETVDALRVWYAVEGKTQWEPTPLHAR